MADKPITRALSLSFTWSFWLSVGAFLVLVVVGLATPQHQGLTAIELLLVLLMLAAGPVWYVSLGMVAHRLGRRWLVWVGLSFITSPIGPLVIYPLMLSHIRAARQPTPVTP